MESWLPIGLPIVDGYKTQQVIQSGNDWQILKGSSSSRILILKPSLMDKWVECGLLDEGSVNKITFGEEVYFSLVSAEMYQLTYIQSASSPSSFGEAHAFAMAMNETRKKNNDLMFHDSIYVEKISRLLPTYTLSSSVSDDIVLGYWLTGGLPIPAKSFRRLCNSISWLSPKKLREVVNASGAVDINDLEVEKMKQAEDGESVPHDGLKVISPGLKDVSAGVFDLPGRHELTGFFNEYVIDIVSNEDRYKKMAIDFPSAIILYGPPGCGKTYAVERLTDFLGWPMFEVDASTIASPYIHETSKKIYEIFSKAIDKAPSVLVIDEMDAFLSSRDAGNGQHRVEEISEFLRRIPEAIKNKVLVIAMTNRIDMIDPAILRRGRFDHIVKVNYANSEEIENMLTSALDKIPKTDDIRLHEISEKLSGRPLSDAAFVVREAARLAAKGSKDRLDQESLEQALASATNREEPIEKTRKIGFI
jgi:hypothetical protein